MRGIEISQKTFRRLRLPAKPDGTSELVMRQFLDGSGKTENQNKKNRPAMYRQRFKN